MAPSKTKDTAALKACFVISPFGVPNTETRRRADYILIHFLRPACISAGYTATRSDELDNDDVDAGIRESLFGSPMAIAYLGSRLSCLQAATCNIPSAWNDSVMVEMGYRLAAQLPLVIVCDSLPEGANLNLPPLFGLPRAIMVPCGKDELDPGDPVQKTQIDKIVAEIARRIGTLKEKGSIDSDHPVALVHTQAGGNSDPSDPENMFFVSASSMANELFGFDESGNHKRLRLTGRTMKQFLDILSFRMDRRQYEAFLRSQQQARSTWTESEGEEAWCTPNVQVPIVINRHPREKFIGRSYLPIVVNKFVSPSWSTLRVLYLDVTAVSTQPDSEGHERRPNDDALYYCDLSIDAPPLFPSKRAEPLHVFLCYNSLDRLAVEKTLERLIDLHPSVYPWMDQSEFAGGEKYVDDLGRIALKADAAFVFLGPNRLGPFQKREVPVLIDQASNSQRKKLVILPILLDGMDIGQARTIEELVLLTPDNFVRIEQIISDSKLIKFFEKHFPGRLTL